MLRKFTIFILFSGLITLLVSVSKPLQEQMNDPQAKVVLDKVSNKFKSIAAIHAKFTQNIESPGGKTTTKTGEVFLKAGKFRIQFSDQIIYCDQQSVWTYLKDNNEVQVNDYEPSQEDITPSNIFNIYESDFFYIKQESEIISGVSCHVIDLAPKDKTRTYFKIRLWIDSKTNIAKRVKIFDKNGYRYVYNINSVNTTIQLTDAFFKFNKADYPGVTVEDQRF